MSEATNSIRNNRQSVIDILMSKPLVTISSSWTTDKGFVNHEYIVVHSAPPAIVSRIIRECVMVSLVDGALLIPVKD